MDCGRSAETHLVNCPWGVIDVKAWTESEISVAPPPTRCAHGEVPAPVPALRSQPSVRGEKDYTLKHTHPPPTQNHIQVRVTLPMPPAQPS